MLRYDWSNPFRRFFIGMLASAVVVAGAHMGYGHHHVTPVGCNGGWRAALSVFAQLFSLVIFLEVTGRIIWQFSGESDSRTAKTATADPDDYVLSGGKFLGPKASTMSLAVAILLIFFGERFVGIPDACPQLDVPTFSTRLLIGGWLMMYGILIGTDYFWHRPPKSSSASSG